MSRSTSICASVLLWSATVAYAPLPAHADFLPPGPDAVVGIPVSTGTSFNPVPSEIEWLPDGSFFVLFEIAYSDNDVFVLPSGSYLQHVAQNGALIGSPVRVNSVDGEIARSPRFARNPDGVMMVVFWTFEPGVGEESFARAFDASGNPLSLEFPLRVSAMPQVSPDVAYLGSDTWIAVWTEIEQWPNEHLLIRRFDNLGTMLGTESMLVPDGFDLSATSIVSNGDGIYAISWADRADDGTINVEMFDSNDQSIVSRVLNAPTNGAGGIVRPAMASDGTLVVQHVAFFGGLPPMAEVLASDGSTIASVTIGSEPIAVTPDGRWIAQRSPESYLQHETDGTPIGRSYAARSDLQPMSLWDVNVAANASGSLAVIYKATRNRNFFYDTGAVPIHEPVRHYLHVICDSSDPLCDRCPAGDETDTDSDGRPDACDPCTTPSDSAQTISASVTVANAERTPLKPPRGNAVRVTATAVLPDASGGFSTLPIVERGLRIRMETEDQGEIVEAQLPGGLYGGMGTRGWTAKTGIFRYRDTTDAPIRGFRKARVRDMSSRMPDLVAIDAKASGNQYGVGANYVPLTLAITFGDRTDDSAGLCAELSFGDTECSAVMEGIHTGRMTCRLEP